MEKRTQRDRRRRRRRRRKKTHHHHHQHHHHHHLQRHRIYPRSMHFCAHDRRGLPRRRAPAPFPKIERHSISSARKRRIKTRCCCCLLPSKSPFAKSPTDFFAASTRNDATRREERCAIFLLATVLAGAARNANFCADAAANEDMSIFTLRCVCFGVRTREKSAGFRIAITHLSSPMDIYWYAKNHSNNAIEFFFSPFSLFSLLFFSSRKDTKGSKRSDAMRERFYVLHVEGDKRDKDTHKKKRKKKLDMSLGFLKCVWKKQTKKKIKKNTRTKVSSSSSHRFRL